MNYSQILFEKATSFAENLKVNTDISSIFLGGSGSRGVEE